jgi:type III restriction enzyme
MVATLFALKDYQRQTLDAFGEYLKEVDRQNDPDAAFYVRTRKKYIPAPYFETTPYICLRVPTGGGKTVLAAHAIPLAADLYLRTDQPTVIWFTPSQTIRDQTLKTLRDRSHPNRQALSARYGENVRIMDTDEALYARRSDYDGGAVIIVSTIQAFRVDKKEGRKVYEANGELMDHFSGLTEAALKVLERGAGGDVIPSLANVFRLRRPMIVADEAHNMSTELSFDTLGRLGPSLILEFTATPITAREHNPAKGKYGSNVLHHVSAAELKAADMIKLPVVLTGRPDPKETLADAIGALERLSDTGRMEEQATQEFIRPVMLLQAEAKSKDRETLHAEALKTMLIEDFRVPPEHIALATGDAKELNGVDLFARDCLIRFIITQQALREGWDCSFAYVLCSVANQKSERTVEQLLGRVLRLPYAKRKKHDELNSAFAFATTTDFREAASLLKDGLVANGFEAVEAETLIQTAEPIRGLEEGGSAFVHEVPLPDNSDVNAMAITLQNLTRGRVTIDPERNLFVARGALSDYDRKHLILAMPHAEKQIDALVFKSRNVPLKPVTDHGKHIEFNIPGLSVRRDNKLELFDTAHFLVDPWDLENYDASAILDEFRPVPSAETATIDITEKGKIAIDFDEAVPLLHGLREPNWTPAKLTNWLDRKIPYKERSDIRPMSSKFFIGKAIEAIMASTGQDIGEVARAKFRIFSALTKTIARHRNTRESRAFQLALLPQSGLEFATNSEISFHFNSRYDRDYCFNTAYQGPPFKKHLFPIVGDLESKGEEYECAAYIDRLAGVRVWLRNTERKSNSFWIQSVPYKFYPDFILLLEDGRFLVVEYKGKYLIQDSKYKEQVGDLWADGSNGQCLFRMVTDQQFGMIDRAIQS